jgi:outer membrane autotransporter protein
LANRQVWAKAFGSHANQDDQSGASGFSSDAWGMAFGAEGELNRDTRLGVTYAYANSSVDGNAGLSGISQHANVDSHMLGLYGSHALANDLQLDWQADIGRNGIDGSRHINFGGLNRTASSNYASYSAHVGAGLSKDFGLSERTTIAPGVRVDYTWLRDQSYRESGADALNLDVDSNTTKAFVITTEGRLRHTLSAQSWLNANVGIGYDTINDRGNVVSTYAGAPGLSFATQGIDHSPWLISGGIGYTMQANANTQITLRYDVEGRDSYLNQSASLKANWAF